MTSPLIPDPDLSLDQIAPGLRQIAARNHLLMVPAMPLRNVGTGFTVVLSRQHMAASDFIDLAATAGAKLLYVQAEPFSFDTDLNLDDLDENIFGAWDEADADVESVRAEARVHDGQIGEIHLGFAMGGVLHCWVAAEAWYSRVMAALRTGTGCRR